MKATHKHKGLTDRVFHLCSDGTTVYVSVENSGWRKSLWSNDKRFHEIAEKINTFKGNK